jgi:hypothetical protein
MNKTIEIDYSEGEGLDRYELKGKVTMKRLNFSEKNAMEEEATEIKMFGTTPQVKVSTSKIKELGIFKAIVESNLVRTLYVEDRVTKTHNPVQTQINLDLEGIRNLPQDVGELLLEGFTDLNVLSEKKK